MQNSTSFPVRIHPLTGEPLELIGTNPRTGALRWPIMGGAPDDDESSDDDSDDDDSTEDDDSSDDTDDDSSDGSGDLGDAGKKALNRMKSQRNAAKTELKAYKNLGLSPADIKKLQDAKSGGGDDDKIDVDKIRNEARSEAQREALTGRAEDKIEARAAKKFADAEDAVAILMRENDIEDFIDADKIDVDAIQEALDDLLERKPHLAVADGGDAAQGGRKKKFGGSADGGARNGSTKPTQLTKADVERLAKEGKHKEIEKARRDGRLKDLLSGK